MTIAATLVKRGLAAARLPLTVAEVTLRHGAQQEEWPPSIAFDAFGATVKEVVGSIARDHTLVDEGRLTRAKVHELRRSTELETRAEVLQEHADGRLTERLEEDEARRDAAARRAEARKRTARQAKAEAKREADERLDREKQRAAKADKATKAATERRERAVRAQHTAAERNAIADEREALAAKDTVGRISDELETTRSDAPSSSSGGSGSRR